MSGLRARSAKFICAVSISFFSAGNCFSQIDSIGIYTSVKDFRDNKLTISAPCAKGKNKVKTTGKFLTLQLDEEKQHYSRYSKKEVFAFKTCDNIYRLQDGLEYKVVNTQHIPMYSRTVNEGAGESTYLEDKFFFSVESDGEIIPLTKSNLYKAYSSNIKFLQYVSSHFKNGYDMGAFNKELKQYTLIYYYEKAMIQTSETP